MFDILLRWLKGYLFINLSGDAKERFIKICRLNDILLWKIKKKNENTCFCVSRKDYKKIEGYAKKTNCHIDINDKCGLPFFMYKYKKRKCFIIGVIFFMFLILYSNIFIWKINVSGSQIYTEEQVLNYIKTELVSPGTKKSEVNCEQIEFLLREKYDKIAWISCYIKGTEFYVEISDTIEPDKIEIMHEPCNIIAVKDATIVDMITKSGISVVENGERIEKGDVLITGVVEIYNDYDELVDINLVAADGFVYGETIYDYYDDFEIRHYEKEYTGNEVSYFSLAFADKMCTPYIPKIEYLHYDIIVDTKDIKVNNTYTAPISFYKTTVKEYVPVAKAYTEQEATEKAKKRLELYIENLEKKGVEILENNVTIEIVEGKLISSGTIVAKELVGIPEIIDSDSVDLSKIKSTEIQGE